MKKVLFLSLFLMSVVCLSPTQINSISSSEINDEMINEDTQKPEVNTALEGVPNHNKPFVQNSQLQNSTEAANRKGSDVSGSGNADVSKEQKRKQSTTGDQNKKAKEDDVSLLQKVAKKKVKIEKPQSQREIVEKNGKIPIENVNLQQLQISQPARTKQKGEGKVEESKQEVNKKVEVSPNKPISPESGKAVQTSKEKIQKNIQAKKIMTSPSRPQQNIEQKEGQQVKNRYSQENFQDEKQKQRQHQESTANQPLGDSAVNYKEEKTKSTQEVPKPASQKIEEEEETIVIKPASSKNIQKELNPLQKSDIVSQKNEDKVKVAGLAEKKQSEGKVVSEDKRQPVAVGTDHKQDQTDVRSEQKVKTTLHSQIVSSQQKRDSVANEAKNQFEENRQIQHKIKIIPLEDEPFTSKEHENEKQIQEGALSSSSPNSRGGNKEETQPPPQNSKKEEGDKTEKQSNKQKDQFHQSVESVVSDKDLSPEKDKKIQKLIQEVKNTKGQLPQDSKKQIIKYLQAGKTVEKEIEKQIQSQKTVLRMERTARSEKQQSSEAFQTVAKDRDFINQQQMDTTTIVIIIILTFVISIPIFREIRRKEGDESAKQEKQNLNNVKEGGEKVQTFPDFNEMSYQSGFQIGERIDEDFS